MTALRERIAQASDAASTSTCVLIPRADASSATLVKVVRALASDAAAAAAPQSSSSLRLAVWVVSALFQRARNAQTARLRSAPADAAHAWCAVVALLRVVGYNGAACGDVLRAAALGLVEALGPLRQVWAARTAVTMERERVHRSTRLIKGEADDRASPFAKRNASKHRAGNDRRSAATVAKWAASGEVARVFESRASASLFARRPLDDTELDMDDAYALDRRASASAATSSSSSVAHAMLVLGDADADARAPTSQLGGTSRHRDPVDAWTLAAEPASAKRSESRHNAVAAQHQHQHQHQSQPKHESSATDRDEQAWMMRALARAISLPIADRQMASSAPTTSTKQKRARGDNQGATSAAATAAGANKAMSDAANMIWAGAPRSDRGEELSNSLAALEMLNRVLSPDDRAATKGFTACLCALRALAALTLTATSRRRGDCLASHGQLIGSVLVGAESPTFVLAVAKHQQEQQQPQPLTLLDLGAFTHHALSKPTDVVRTAAKIQSFLDRNNDGGGAGSHHTTSFRDALAQSTCLSLYSHVVTIALDSEAELARRCQLLLGPDAAPRRASAPATDTEEGEGERELALDDVAPGAGAVSSRPAASAGTLVVVRDRVLATPTLEAQSAERSVASFASSSRIAVESRLSFLFSFCTFCS